MVNYVIIESNETKQHFIYDRLLIENAPKGKILSSSEWTDVDIREIIESMFNDFGDLIDERLADILFETGKEIGLSNKMAKKLVRTFAKKINELEI